MKRSFITFGLLVAAAFALTNCAEKESIAPVQKETVETVPFQVTANFAETKTVNDGLSTKWETGDQISLSYSLEVAGQTFAGEFNTPLTTENADGVFTSNVELDDALTTIIALAGKLEMKAVYPYGSDGVLPKSTVQEGYNSTKHLAGPAIPLVGSVTVETSIADLLKGKLTTPEILLDHVASVVEVEVTNNSKEPIVINRVSFGVGSNVKATTEVENGESLAVGEKATVYVVVEPATINPEDGNIKFWVNDTPQEIKVVEPVTLNAGKIRKMHFDYKGDYPELYAVADVAVEMTADRIVPSVKTLIDYNYLKEWAANLKAQENIEALLQEVLVSVVAGDLESAYHTLGGLPGFEHQIEIVSGFARYVEKVNYEVSDYLSSYIEDIKKVKDVESLIALLDDFMSYYKVSGTKDQLLGGIGVLSDYITDFSQMIASWFPNSNSILVQTAIKLAETKLKELLDVNIVDIMAEAVADPDSWQAKALDWMFSQTAIRDAILDSIVNVIKGIEDATNGSIADTNEAWKQAGILSARTTALYQAKIAAQKVVEKNFNQLNQNELDKLNNSVWGIFRMILNWDKTKAVFEELNITAVYDIFQQIAVKIEEVVMYEEGPYTIVSEPAIADIPVLTPSQLAELIAE
jgi:hypothetical protein